jgi:hypothetical protein
VIVNMVLISLRYNVCWTNVCLFWLAAEFFNLWYFVLFEVEWLFGPNALFWFCVIP